MFANVAITFDHNLIFTLVFLGVAAAVGVYALNASRSLLWWLRAEAVVVLAAICYLSYVVFEPVLFSKTPTQEAAAKLELPAYDYSAWRSLPVQVDGRVRPFDTAAREVLRHITGHEKFEGQRDPVAIVVQWMLAPEGAPGDAFTDWTTKAFIRCDHQDLRREIFQHLETPEQPLTDEQVHGKFVSPSELRGSPGLEKLLASAREKRRQDPEKASQNMTPAERKAEEVEGRLGEFLAISQINAQGYTGRDRVPDPFHFAVLDRVPTGDWFSFGQLRDLQQTAKGNVWMSLIYDRLSQRPQQYLDQDPKHLEALQKFQQQLQAGEGTKAVDTLAQVLKERREQKLNEFEALQRNGNIDQAGRFLLTEILKTPEENQRIMALVHRDRAANREPAKDEMINEVRGILNDRDEKLLSELKARAERAVQQGYRPDNAEYRMLHLDYLEALFPNFYRDALVAHAYPKEDAERLLASRTALVQAYRSNDPEKFSTASQKFVTALREVNERYAPYPGQDSVGVRLVGLLHGRPAANPDVELLNLELQFNKVQPFMWAWILMLGGAVCFIASMALNSRVAYGLGFVAYLASLGYQLFGFYARVSISGRPPVSNMYETVIWVAFMSGVFALILEMIYRRKVIALAGSLVSTLGLVLADQLPLALDPRINPIVPVLRSNYWLTIHVLTIVSSYAGGTLAWGLGNITLALMAFGSPRRDVLKTLSQYTYRAIQIAVLLLAAGTFLGGWWAAESWGRFWGWDPKEVWALIALVCYVIPLHARYIGWVKDFGLAVSAVLCYAAIVMSWYGVNFVLGAGLHSYGFGGGGPWWVFWAGLINIEWVLYASVCYLERTQPVLAETKASSGKELIEV